MSAAMVSKPVKSPQSADTISLAQISCAELEELHDNPDSFHSFPQACRSMLLEMDGNARCVDCDNKNPEWAAVSYGALVCINCSGKHRSLGVNNSKVRSITMDHWTYEEVVQMLEGGNLVPTLLANPTHGQDALDAPEYSGLPPNLLLEISNGIMKVVVVQYSSVPIRPSILLLHTNGNDKGRGSWILE
eukprot:scaffold4180_cov99-Cylindrotheca_fusiformis.AAC.1